MRRSLAKGSGYHLGAGIVERGLFVFGVNMNCRECDTELNEADGQFGGFCADCFADLQGGDLEEQLDYLLQD